MSDDSQVPDNFNTFLKRANQDWAQHAPVTDEADEPAAEAAPPAPPAGAAAEPDVRFRFISFLAEKGPTPIAELQSQFGIGFMEVGSALTKLGEAGLINVTGDPGGEIVELTPRGQKLV